MTVSNKIWQAMARYIDILRDAISTDIFSDIEVFSVTPGSPDRRYGLVKRAMAAGDLIPIKRGVYAFGQRYQRHQLNLFEVSHRLHGCSYVSLESALAYHSWIPESTYTITSVSSRRTQTYETPLGLFSFTHLSSFNYLGVSRVVERPAIFLMATPTKALVDYILARKLDGVTLESLGESLRIDPSALENFSVELLEELTEAHKSQRLKRFTRKVRQRGKA